MQGWKAIFDTVIHCSRVTTGVKSGKVWQLNWFKTIYCAFALQNMMHIKSFTLDRSGSKWVLTSEVQRNLFFWACSWKVPLHTTLNLKSTNSHKKPSQKYQPSFTFFAIIIIPGIHKRCLLNINVQTSPHRAAAVRAASVFFFSVVWCFIPCM